MQLDEKGEFVSAGSGAYWKRCDLPTGCFLQSSRVLGHYSNVQPGKSSFDQPQFFFVKPLTRARSVPPGWGRHKKVCHTQPRFHHTRVCE